MNRIYSYIGVIASGLLIAFGIGAVVAGLIGRDQVHDEIAREHIVGTPDMEGVANKKIENGSDARQFADGIRKHTLEATGGQTYAEMPRYASADGKGTNDEAAATKNPETGKPVDNPARQIWVTSTALSTALNTSYFAEQVATFAIVMGIALILAGGGFAVVALRLLRQAPERESVSA